MKYDTITAQEITAVRGTTSLRHVFRDELFCETFADVESLPYTEGGVIWQGGLVGGQLMIAASLGKGLRAGDLGIVK